MPTAVTHRRFDVKHVRIDTKLHGVILASFSRRTVAYLIDWAIVMLCTQFLWLTIIVVAVWLLFNKQSRRSLLKRSVLIRYYVRQVDRWMEQRDVKYSLRKQARRHLTWYIYFALYAPIVVALAVLAGIVTGILSPNEYGAVTEKYVQGAMFFHPFKDIYNGFTFIGGFVGGLLYFALFTWRWQGQTPGKRLMKIRVVKLNGTPLTLWNSFERFSGYSASASLLLLGFFQYYWDVNRQTTHDKVVETIVVVN